MPSPPKQSHDVAHEFATSFVEESFEDAAALLSENGGEAVVDSYPDGFQREELDAVDTLEQYWYGLYGQYRGPEGVEDVSGDADDGADDTTGDGRDVTIELSFADGSHALELTVEDGNVVDFALPAEYEPPSYADRDAFTERDVTVDAGDLALDGVLAVPDGDGPFPGVVLVHGAGIHDPDGDAGSSKILKDFAWGLASRGIAVLRYEKRLRDNEVDDENETFDTVVVDDAITAVDRLTDVDEVAADSVFVAGHSQGGMAAPTIADRSGGVAGVVSIDGAANPRPDPDDLSSLRYSIEPDGDLTEDQEAELEAMREPFRRLATDDFEPDEEILGRPGRWHRSMFDTDPSGTAASLDAPVFVAKAGRADPDVQPELRELHERRLAAWRDVDLAAGSRVEFYEEVGHYMQEGYEPTTMAHLYFGGNVADYVVADVAEWVHEVGAI